MKKICYGLAALCLLGLASCKSTTYTATEVPSTNILCTSTVANLEVGNKVTYSYKVPYDVKKGGVNNVKRAAIAAMLKANGDADVIVAPEYKYDAALSYMEVTGRPAKYTNFRSANK